MKINKIYGKDYSCLILAFCISVSALFAPMAYAKKKNSYIIVPKATNIIPTNNMLVKPVASATYNPEIPYYVNFAGSKVDLDRLDMFERFDRELTSLTFGHSNTLLTIKRVNRFFPMMVPILKSYGIPEDFMYLAAIESFFNIRAHSGAGAAGIWQILSATARQYGLEVNDEVDERYDPIKSTIAACKYLKQGYSKYKNWATVAASYNAGMGRISSELAKQLVSNSFDLYLNEETSRYVFRILAMKEIMENPREFNFILSANQLYQLVKYNEVEVNGPVNNWNEWSKQNGTTFAQLKELNPWIRKTYLTNKSGKLYKIKIPLENELYRSKREFNVYNNKWVSE